MLHTAKAFDGIPTLLVRFVLIFDYHCVS
jgi:hypothetical protein